SAPVSWIDTSGYADLPPPLEPIREGMLIGDYPGLSTAWRESTQEVLERQYEMGSYEKNLQAFQEEALKLPVGSNRQPNTRIYLARKTFDKVADAFSKKVELPEDTQIHHALKDGGLAEDPLGALDASHLEIVKGKTAVVGTSHNRADRAVKYQK